MTEKFTFLYQDIAEPASLEVPPSSSWQPEHSQPRGDSWAKKWSIAALTAVSLAYVGEPITPPETITADKWYQQLSTPPPPKAGLHASLQQFANPDPLPTLPGDATELEVYPDFDKLPVTDGPITLQGEFAYGAPVAISDVRWLEPFSEPVLAKLRFDYPQEARVEVVAAAAETVTIDKWYQPLGLPGEPEGMLVVGDFGFLSVEVTNIAWYVPLSEPLYAKPGLHAARQQFEVNDTEGLTEAEAVHVQWLTPFGTPVWSKQPVAWQQDKALGEPPITADLTYGWLEPLSEPPGAKEAVAEQQSLAFVGEPSDFGEVETVTLDKWYVALNEPVRTVLPRPDGLYVLGDIPRTGDLQRGWLVPFNEPPKAKPGAAEYQSVAYVGEPISATGDATELLVYPDLEVPPKAAPLRFEYPAVAYVGEPIAEPTPTPEPAADQGRDAGAGHKPWWEGEWIIPGVTHYLPEKPAEDVQPIRPKVERAKRKLQRLKPSTIDTPYRSAISKANALLASVSRLENQAQSVADARDVDAAVAQVTTRYYELTARLAEIEQAIAEHEERAEHRKRIVMDDNEVLKLLLEIL